jgi:hypothetical protein
MRRVLLVVAVAAMICAPTAGAWTWPTDGEVLQPFVFDTAHPYAGGEHRGIDVAGPAGAAVLAPRAGTVTFAGTVPGSGLSLTIATDDGYAVTLTHLGALSVARGATVAEGAPVGRLGSGGDGEHAQPYVHLGVRIAAQAQGYVDPATLLPARPAAPPPIPAPQPVVTAPPPAPTPAPTPAEPMAAAPIAQATAPVVQQAAAVADAADPAPTEPAPSFTVHARPAAPASTFTIRPARVASTAPARPNAVTPTVPIPAKPTVPARPERPVLADPLAPLRGYASRHVADPPAVRIPRLSPARRVAPPPLLPIALAGVSLVALAVAVHARVGLRRAARIIDRRVDEQAQDLGGPGVAVRGWAPAPWPRGGVRGARRRVRALPPAVRQRRADGEWHGRARDADHGRRRQGGEVVR